MQLIIQPVIQPKKVDPYYIATLEFMCGDADGTIHDTLYFKETIDGIENLKATINIFNDFLDYDPNVAHDAHEIMKYHTFIGDEDPEFNGNLNDEYEDTFSQEEFEEFKYNNNPRDIHIIHPLDQNGEPTIFKSIKITYVENNITHDVKVVNNHEK